MSNHRNTNASSKKQAAPNKQNGNKKQPDKKKPGNKKALWIVLASCVSVAIVVTLIVVLVGGEKATDQTTAFFPSDGIDENGFWKDVKALDLVELFDYKSLSIPNDVQQISDDALQTAIDDFLAEHPPQIKDRAVVDGDSVNIDYVGSVDGVEFEGGNTEGKGAPVTIGVTSYIDDFLEQLIGHTPGETFNVEVTFPEDYGQDHLNGKDAVFVTTINYIAGESPDELTDEYVETHISGDEHGHGWKTVVEMKDGLREELIKTAMKEYIRDYLTNEVTVNSIPDKISEYMENSMLNYYQTYADQYEMPLDEFLSSNSIATNKAELIANSKEENRQQAVYYLVCQAVAEDAGLSVDEADMEKYLSGYSSYINQYGLPYLKQYVLCEKVIDYIAENTILA